MDRTLKWRVIIILAVIIVSAVFIYPTVKLASLSKAQREEMSPADLQKLKDKAIKLGLDLQGGMHLVLEVDQAALENTDIENVMSRAETIIRNRVDKFGVSEPVIQKEGNDRLVIQLAGLDDESRAKELIGQTALLEFKLVKEGDEFRQLISRIDETMAPEIAEITMTGDTEDLEKQLREAAAETDTAGLREEIEAATAEGRSLLGMVKFIRVGTHEDAIVAEDDIPVVKEILDRAGKEGVIPADVQILWDYQVEQGRDEKFERVYLVNRKASLTGKYIDRAIVRWGLSRSQPSAPGVSLEFDRLGRSLFSRVTGDNVNRRLAIILDDKVRSAPNIEEKIRGAASITGSFSAEQAQDLAIVLEAGALPAPLDIVEERTVGPSLGSDSIREGVRAALVGGIAVAIFMVLYYNLSGLLAVVALALNLVIMLAALAGLRGTLTLPGIAGVILTIGMAVDANVLIFERIREELATGKTVRRAIKDGYSRAFITILDANVTTLITAVVLYQFGTGPIRGFAVTLSIGILASMFTAIVVTRTIYDSITSMRKIAKLSI